MSRLMLICLLVSVLALTACTPAPAAPTPAPAPEAVPTVPLDPNASVKVESARPLTDVLGEQEAVFATLSPDGTRIAYFLAGDRNTAGKLCQYIFDGAVKKCTDLPLDQFLGYPYQLQWSPDNSKVAFTENPLDFGNDADIWVLNVADETVANITDDSVAGPWVQPTGTPSTVVDYLPMWGPTDGQIYFWRFQNQGEYMNFTLGLYKIDPAGGEPVQVVDVGKALPFSVPTFTQEKLFLDGPSAISPDGKSVAALLSSQSDMGSTQRTLYNIPLDGSAPVQLLDSAAYNAVIPEWSGYAALPVGVSWTADGNGLLSIAGTTASPTPFVVFFYSPAAGGASTPLVDFSSVTDPELYSQPLPGSNNSIPARWYSPWTGGLSPKGDKVLMINDLGGTVGLMSAILPPTGDLPAISATAPSVSIFTGSRTSRSTDGKMTLYGLLLQVTE